MINVITFCPFISLLILYCVTMNIVKLLCTYILSALYISVKLIKRLFLLSLPDFIMVNKDFFISVLSGIPYVWRSSTDIHKRVITQGLRQDASAVLMAADADIIFCSCGFYLSFFFFFLSSPILSSRILDVYHTSTLSANLECRSEMCCTRLAVKYRMQKLCKKSQSPHHRTTLSEYRAILATVAHIDNQKKNLLNSNISSTGPHNMVNLGPLTAYIGSGVWSIPASFNWFRVLASLVHRRRSIDVNQTLYDVWPSLWLLHCTYILGALAP